MPFTDEQIADLYEGFHEVDPKFRDLRERFVLRPFQNAGAREHADQGFSRRLGSLARCIERVFEILPPDRVEIPDRNETQDAALNIQAFVMNAFGCCENLAWVWVLERGVRENDGSELAAGRIGLGPTCRTVRRSFSQEFRDYLETRRPWFEHLKDFRDALAHRIPLYIPPFMVASEDWDQWKALGDEAMAALLQGDLDEETTLKVKQAELARFDPVMAHSLVAGPGAVVFHYQLLADFSTIHEIATEFLAELDR